MAAFSYDKLRSEDGEFRLVRFSDSAASPDVIELILERASLHNPPSYSALSYLWGEPTKTETIHVNGLPLPITHNLHQALQHLRAGEGTREWLWIDAVCINQDDDEERSWHVPQMGTIFSRASLVYIWLGPDSDDSDLVMRLAQRIGPDAHEAGVADLWFCWPPFKLPRKKLENEERANSFLARALGDEELRSPRLLAAVEPLLSRANWCRAWIVQEIALARDGLVCCGTERVSLNAFDATLSTIFFCKNGVFALQHPRWRDFGSGLRNNNIFRVRGLIARRQRRRGHKAGLLEFLMSDFASANRRPFYVASDPRDIIFGLLGVAADTELLGLRPDYTQTTAEVYAAVTRAILERCPDYSLDYCTFPKDIQDLPSWVPDWQRIGRYGLADGYRYPLSYSCRFTGSGDRVQPSPPPPASFPGTVDGIPSWRVLRQRGCLVDVVAAVFQVRERRHGCALPLSHALDTKWKLRARVLNSILEFATSGHLALDGGTPVETALWRTLVADQLQGERCTAEYDALAGRIFRLQKIPVETLTKTQLAFLFPRGYFGDDKFRSASQANVDEASERVLIQASVKCRRRTLFATAGGKPGLGPESMQTGDVVAILLGTAVPIVLRPVGNHFTYVGEAYVHGIMYGEFMRGDPPEQDFDIA
ncbi:uncharacterized protein THITE_2038030 [Thermothielavioides terrestris NRRL 8126]|uniref:Heterokaryon incompatibility domain-containing protein n=1 Tax=Thermothielavioides terrestris (strain ATCC 38088 / NRRL 8126) TaxID=578455 RepID=G2QWL2_THETT|nr:uncharacterized protein THITE_2038030 [Thermothielavioides terrestris NRRL 8126]AEO64787.1 hypothetical protein THITE_2038030 [Thermothielavioides terrestris NRRL 8126]